MARTAGSPLNVCLIKIHIPEDWVCKQGRHRYVFVDALSPKVYQLSRRKDGTKTLYNRFHVILTRKLYNLKILYGIRAIDIDQPHIDGFDVSVRLEIIVGDGEDSYELIKSSW